MGSADPPRRAVVGLRAATHALREEASMPGIRCVARGSTWRALDAEIRQRAARVEVAGPRRRALRAAPTLNAYRRHSSRVAPAQRRDAFAVCVARWCSAYTRSPVLRCATLSLRTRVVAADGCARFSMCTSGSDRQRHDREDRRSGQDGSRAHGFRLTTRVFGGYAAGSSAVVCFLMKLTSKSTITSRAADGLVSFNMS